MKILIIRPWPSLLDVTKNTYNIQEVGLAKALVKRGHSTDILFWTDGDEMTVEVEAEGGKPIRVFYRHGKVLLKNVWFSGQDALFAQYDVLQTAEYNQMFSWHLAGKYPEKTVIYHGPYYSPFNKNYNRMCRVFDAFFRGALPPPGHPVSDQERAGPEVPAGKAALAGAGDDGGRRHRRRASTRPSGRRAYRAGREDARPEKRA